MPRTRAGLIVADRRVFQRCQTGFDQPHEFPVEAEPRDLKRATDVRSPSNTTPASFNTRTFSSSSGRIRPRIERSSRAVSDSDHCFQLRRIALCDTSRHRFAPLQSCCKWYPFYVRVPTDQSRIRFKDRRNMARTFLEISGGSALDLTGPKVIARCARAGHDGQTFHHEPTAHVLALRARRLGAVDRYLARSSFLF